jgi:hypothetical protein
VRTRVLEYVDEKTAGLYGHSKIQLRRFAARLAPESVVDSQTKLAAASQKAGNYRPDLRPVPLHGTIGSQQPTGKRQSFSLGITPARGGPHRR